MGKGSLKPQTLSAGNCETRWNSYLPAVLMVDNLEVDLSHYSSTCSGSGGHTKSPEDNVYMLGFFFFFLHELGHLSTSLVQSFSQPDIFAHDKSLQKVPFVSVPKKRFAKIYFCKGRLCINVYGQ